MSTSSTQIIEPEPIQAMLRLKQLGVTDEQIASSHFLPKYSTCPLEDQPFTWDPSIPDRELLRILPLLRRALIYRIIISGDPLDAPFYQEAVRELAMMPWHSF